MTMNDSFLRSVWSIESSVSNILHSLLAHHTLLYCQQAMREKVSESSAFKESERSCTIVQETKLSLNPKTFLFLRGISVMQLY